MIYLLMTDITNYIVTSTNSEKNRETTVLKMSQLKCDVIVDLIDSLVFFLIASNY